jgi:hypothetical protein
VRRVSSIRQLRPNVGIDAELDWYFNQSACDMGAQSNYLAMLGLEGPGSAIPSPEDAVEAAHRARIIRDRLRAMRSGDAGVLQCAYELRAWPVVLWDALGRLTGVVARLATALDPQPEDHDALQAIEMARAEWLARECERAGAHRELTSLRRVAEVRFATAHRAYAALRGDRRTA